jgi:pimeloyl-ACP methyl ester carboxylesterase
MSRETSENAPVAGGQLSAVVEGPEGAPWVTFLPGIGNDAQFWRAQATDLAARYRCLRFDPWGCGDSGPPPPMADIDVVCDGIVDLWDRWGIAASAVVGLGFGGSTALLQAIRHPDRVTGVVACCCRPRQPEDRREFWRDRADRAARDGLDELTTITVERWLRPEFRTAHPEVVAALRAGMLRNSAAGYAAYARAFAQMDFAERLSAVRAPTLLIAAELDHGGGPADAMRAMQLQMPRAELVEAPGCGHIVNWEAPQRVSALLGSFLDELMVQP